MTINHQTRNCITASTNTHLNDWRDELLYKVLLQQLGPVVMEEVDEESLDVGAVLILICHDHDAAVAQRLQRLDRCVLLLVAQADDLDHVVDLCVLHDLCPKVNTHVTV